MISESKKNKVNKPTKVQADRFLHDRRGREVVASLSSHSALPGQEGGPPIDVSRGPFNFWKTTPYKVVLAALHVPQDKEKNGLRLPIVDFHPGSSCPQAAALRQSHSRGRRPPPFPRDHALVGIRSTFAVPTSAIIRTSEHFHVFSPPPRLSVRMFGSGGQETRKRVLELRRPVTVPREICSLGRMNDDRTDLEVSQQCRDLVFGD